jgi:hypothetical protein
MALRFLMAVFLSAVLAATSWAAEKGGPSVPELAQEAQRDFDLTLDLWREGRYEELYRRSRGDKESLEALTRKLSEATHRPACCWEKLQDVQVSVRGPGWAVVNAKVGLEGEGSGTVFRTRSFKLSKEDGVWKMLRSDILSLAGAKKGKKKAAS